MKGRESPDLHHSPALECASNSGKQRAEIGGLSSTHSSHKHGDPRLDKTYYSGGSSVPLGTMVNKAVRLGGCGAFVLFMAYLSEPGSSLFSWHPFLMTLAYTGLMTEAMYTFSKSGLASGQPHSTKVTTHWVLLAAVAAVHFVGWAAIYYTKEANNKPHLTTWHGCLGCLASLLLWVQLSGGIFAKYPRLLARVLPLKTLRSWHSLSGTLVYTVGVVALILSLGSPWYRGKAGDWSVYAALGLHMVLVVGVLKRHVSKYLSASK